MNKADREFWEMILNLTTSKDFRALYEWLDDDRNTLESRMLSADSWEEFLELRGEYRRVNWLLNLYDIAKTTLEEDDENDSV